MSLSKPLSLCAALLALGHVATAQQPGTLTPEVHPKLITQKCTTAGGCVNRNTSVVLDFGYRWIHTVGGYDSCATSSGAMNTTLCPDESTCSKNCVVEGVDYATSGVSTSGSSLTMSQYIDNNGTYQNASPRIYLFDESTNNYEDMQLLGQELTFDVDLSTTPCGENAALYLSEMDISGGRNQYQTGGAAYGGGYCDAQCPVATWRNGTLNTASASYCCNEMDILESNSEAAAMTPHPCNDGDTDCDKGGCGFNAYAQGVKNYWSPGGTLDTSKPFTVTTQFITTDGTKTGTLSQIKRIYQQGGKTLPSAISGGDIITTDSCNAADSTAATFGSLPTMGKALGRGMVLVFAIWNDNSGNMNWLDSGANGPCSTTAGAPASILANDPTTHVVFSNIKWGDIGSTTKSTGASNPGSPGTTVSVAPASTTVAATKTSTAAGPTQSQWGQCGGIGFSGPTACAAGYKCNVINPYYSQCY